jgi:hypothetical protein
MATLTAPAPYAVFVTRGGKYTADSNSSITATAQQDIQDLIAAGCEVVNPSIVTVAQVTHLSTTASTANGAISILPANATITAIQFRETTGHAVTGGINIGTTPGGSDILSAVPVGAGKLVNVNEAALSLQWLSSSLDKQLYISAVSSWNSASVDTLIRFDPGTAVASTTAPGSQILGDLTTNGNVNIKGSSGLMINGANAINVGSGAIRIGNSAGAAFDISTAAWDVYVGTKAGQTHTTGSGENVGIGSWAMRFMTTGTHNTAIGQTALMSETTGVANAAFGTDAMRNVAGTSNGTTCGSDAGKYGNMTANVAVGAQALSACSSSVTITGTATASDVIGISIVAPLIDGGAAHPVTFTVTAGLTTTQMATGLAAAINSDATLSGLINGSTGAAFGAAATGNVVSLFWAGTQLVGPLLPVITTTVTGAATEVLTLAGGPSGGFGNIAIGYKAMFCPALSTAAGNVAIGSSVLGALTTGNSNVSIGAVNSSALTSGGSNVAIGQGALNTATTASSNVCVGSLAGNAFVSGTFNTFVGASSGALFTGTTGSNTCFGYQAGNGLTTGFSNTIIGPCNAAQSAAQITSGSANVAIGNQVAVASATTNNQLVISNFIYGTGMSGTGTTISVGKIGLGIKAPAVELDVVGTINASVAHQVAGTQVVGARATGWVAMTGTPDNTTAFATSTVTLAQLAGRVMAMQAALTTHGLLGT